jgi:hypothetical protein
VLGEVHVGNALNSGTFVDCHPRRSELDETVAGDLPVPRIIVTPPKNWPGVSARSAQRLHAAGDLQVIVRDDVHGAYGDRVVPLADLLVTRRDGELEVSTGDGQRRFPLLELFGSVLTFHVFNDFRPFESHDVHSPRLAFGPLVVARETWRVDAAALDFVERDGEEERFLAIQDWRARTRMPRWCFYRVPTEPKPIYVDFGSPLFVDLFVSRVKRLRTRAATANQTVIVTESLPRLDQAWLADAAGGRYTSELRCVMVDTQA